MSTSARPPGWSQSAEEPAVLTPARRLLLRAVAAACGAQASLEGPGPLLCIYESRALTRAQIVGRLMAAAAAPWSAALKNRLRVVAHFI